jgi:superfamily II DNA or RNA helicase
MAIGVRDVDHIRLGAFVGEVTFLPADPPRDAAFALWRPVPGFASQGEVRLFVARAEGVRPEVVPAVLAPVAAAIPWLAQSPERGTSSLLAWRAVVRAGLALVARGKLHPSISPAGYDCWTAGPLEAEDTAMLDALAAALPAEAHAVPLTGDPTRACGPAAMIQACWAAIADALPRTAGAAAAFGGPLYADRRSHSARHLARHVVSLRGELGTGSQPVKLRVQLSSGGAPRLALDSPGTVPYGTRVALHRGARRWRPLERVSSNGGTALAEAELDQLFDAEPQLRSVGIEVALPEPEVLEVRAVVGSEAGRGADPVFTLDALLEFHWELAVGADRLTSAEVQDLAKSHRRLVQLRDRWLSVDPELVEMVTRDPRIRMRAGEALAAALTGTIELDGRSLAASAVGRLQELGGRLRESAGPREELEPPGLAATLRGYQRRGLAWLREMCELGLGGCLADDMGLGKTIQVIALHLARRGGPILVVSPASLLGNWERELRTFAPGEPVRRYHGGCRELDGLGPNEVTLTTYGVLRRDRARLAEVEWDLVVADEAQQIKNAASASARELRRLSARARVALTGTPVENRLLDLWAILDWTTPGLLGSREAFKSWAAAVERGGDERADARLRQLLHPFVLRRRKIDPGVAPELPPKIETNHLVALTREQVGLYEAVVEETVAAIRGSGGIQRRGLVLKLITLLKQICNHPAQYLRQDGPLAGRSGKLEALDDLLAVILAEGESALVFTQYVGMGNLLARHLAGRCATAFLHGGLAVRRRDDMVRRFQSGEVPVFLVSLRAGGFGLNLSRATHVVHFDRWWNPAVEDQATDRAHRIGQDRSVQVHRLITEGTVEDRIAALLARKRDLADRVVGAGEAWLSELSDEELSQLVQLQRAS